MKKILLTFLLLISFSAFTAEPVDPLKEPLSNLNCAYPIARENGDVLDWAVEGDTINWYYGFTSGAYEFGPVNTTACQWVVDNKLFAGKTIYATATATDKQMRVSVYSPDEWVHEVLPIVLPPKPPTVMLTTPATSGQVATPLP